MDLLDISAETPYDLRFRWLGIPVRVHPMFWLVTACMGWNPDHPEYVAVWLACVFVSILVHEFGHALMTRRFGGYPSVILQGMGGLCVGGGGESLSERSAVILAGPGAGLALFVLVLTLCQATIGLGFNEVLGIFGFGPVEVAMSGARKLSKIASPFVRNAVWDLIYINLFWSLMNLLPIYPLDGGQFFEVTLKRFRVYDATKIAHAVGMTLAGLLAVWQFQKGGGGFRAVFFLYFALYNYQALQTIQSQRFGRWD